MAARHVHAKNAAMIMAHAMMTPRIARANIVGHHALARCRRRAAASVEKSCPEK
jgi:hypothetical protein